MFFFQPSDVPRKSIIIFSIIINLLVNKSSFPSPAPTAPKISQKPLAKAKARHKTTLPFQAMVGREEPRQVVVMQLILTAIETL